MRAVALVLLLVAAPVLSGCLGDDGGGGNLDDLSANNSSEFPTVLPDNRSGEFAAFEETNRTDDYGHHAHDLWNGKTRVEVVKMEVEMTPGYGNGKATKEVRLPSGSLIYEGTGKVEVLLENPRRHACEDQFTLNGDYVCTNHLMAAGMDEGPVDPVQDPGLASPVKVKFIHAASDLGDWIEAGEAQWGVPLELKVLGPTWTDMPHSSGSLWQFMVEAPSDLEDTLVFDLVISIVKADEPPQWPGHPVFYDEENHYRKVMDVHGKVVNGEPAQQTMTSPEKLISAGTQTLIVYANVTGYSGQPDPTHFYLYFHNASFQHWNLTSPYDTEHTADVTSHQWIVRMDPNGMDGPYSTQSRWEFMLRGAHTTPAISCINGCFPYEVEYDLTVIATDLKLEDEAYDSSSRA